MESIDREGKRAPLLRPLKYGTPEEIIRVLNAVRAALTELFVSAGLDPAATRATARELGLSKDLVWRVARVTMVDDVHALPAQVPPRSSVERVMEASLKKRGVSQKVIAKVRNAMDEFEAMVRAAAGDRTNFHLMLSSLVTDNVTERQEEIRKQAFMAGSSIWGVQAETAFRAFFVVPSADDPDRLDLANVSGITELRRLRAVAWPIYQQRISDDTGYDYEPQREPIDPRAAEKGGAPLMFDFCPDPPPRILRQRVGQTWDYELLPGLLGNAGATTCVFGSISRRAAVRYRDEHNRQGALSFEFFTPVRLGIADLFVHRDLPFQMPPEVVIFDRLTAPRGYNPGVDEARKLPLSAKAVSLGVGLTGCATRHVPRYLEMLEMAAKRLGVDPNKLRAYRFSLQYPPFPTVVMLRFELPEKAKSG